MTLEDRIERLEKIILVLQSCIPQTRYAREYGYRLKHEDIMIAKDLLKEIKEDINSKGVLEQIAEEQKTLLDTTKAWSKALEHGNIN